MLEPMVCAERPDCFSSSMRLRIISGAASAPAAAAAAAAYQDTLLSCPGLALSMATSVTVHQLARGKSRDHCLNWVSGPLLPHTHTHTQSHTHTLVGGRVQKAGSGWIMPHRRQGQSELIRSPDRLQYSLLSYQRESNRINNGACCGLPQAHFAFNSAGPGTVRLSLSTMGT